MPAGLARTTTNRKGKPSRDQPKQSPQRIKVISSYSPITTSNNLPRNLRNLQITERIKTNFISSIIFDLLVMENFNACIIV
jgi:hypothetical protein